MKIYLARNGIQAGPYTLDELNTMLASGEVVLDDLAWHSGMANWQRLGDLTGNQYRYSPQITDQSRQEVRGFGDNVDFKSEKDQRVSVAELYGCKPVEPSIMLPPKSTPAFSKVSSTTNANEVVYASIGSRFLALAINLVLFIIAFLPFLSAMVKLNPDQQKMTTGSFESRMTYAQTLAEQIPSQVAMMTLMMVGGFILIQLILIVVRGQSFGKLVMGIRAVSQSTKKIPPFTSLVGVRTLLLVVIYWIASAMPFNLALVLVGVNYFMASTNDKKQGWHDRIANTIVVKAHPSQLDKTKK
ncbi:RDD family protein [Moraxella ovis]|uniref:RDD family protein n=1 Tax=Moraxella ovis TaxID=29433 RepID=UPI000D82D575|nr:RDD family protein [Moraxella ovis]SPX84399.1 RDD family [Moraxella ovis]STZ06965.1 RDD family [Moraxella ovis]